MVKIAIAGGSGALGQEIIHALVATKSHDVLVLSRKDIPSTGAFAGTTRIKVDYKDEAQLQKALRGVDVVLSFIVCQTDPGSISQKNLINAAVNAGVKRFAPSEWATSEFDHMPWYEGKAQVRQYLKQINKDRKVIEYCLFQPGLVTNYLTYPYPSAKYLQPFHTPFDFDQCRILSREGGDEDRITFTTVDDIANVVTQAVEYQGEWPIVGGIKGTELSIGQLISLGERIRGRSFNVERLDDNVLRTGEVKPSWLPKLVHSGIPEGHTDALAAQFLAAILLGISAGALNVSDEWNRLLPDYRFTTAEEFLSQAWADKL